MRRKAGASWKPISTAHPVVYAEAGLSVLLPLADGVDDVLLAAQARTAGLAPSPLSWWRAGGASGLLPP